MISAAVVIMSDRASRGQREDSSGPSLRSIVESEGFRVLSLVVIPDDRERIVYTLQGLVGKVEAVFTAGGTGVTDRDVTPEATLEVIDRRLPGIETALLLEGLKKTPMAVLSRQVAGLAGKTLILNLPGNPAAAQESLKPLLPALRHLVEKLRRQEEDCRDQLRRLEEENGKKVP